MPVQNVEGKFGKELPNLPECCEKQVEGRKNDSVIYIVGNAGMVFL